MFIYILGENEPGYCCDLDEVVKFGTTYIQKILDFLSLERMSYREMKDFSILIMLDGEDYCYELSVNKSMNENLINYPPTKLIEYKSEYDEMLNKISVWCNNISYELEEEEKRKEEAKRLETEKKERALYEKLKIKYRD